MTHEPLWTRQDVADYFKIHYTSTYRIKGLESCRVGGIDFPRFDPEKVRALRFKPKKKVA